MTSCNVQKKVPSILRPPLVACALSTASSVHRTCQQRYVLPTSCLEPRWFYFPSVFATTTTSVCSMAGLKLSRFIFKSWLVRTCGKSQPDCTIYSTCQRYLPASSYHCLHITMMRYSGILCVTALSPICSKLVHNFEKYFHMDKLFLQL